MRAFARLYDAVFAAFGIAAALLIGAVALGITADVILRNLKFGTFSWMLETCEYAIFVATFPTAADSREKGNPCFLSHELISG